MWRSIISGRKKCAFCDSAGLVLLLALPALKRVYCPSTMGGFAMTTLRMTRFNPLPTALSLDRNETCHSRNMECGHCDPTHSGREVSTPAPPRAKADGPRPSGLKPARPWPEAAPVTPAPPARPPPARWPRLSSFNSFSGHCFSAECSLLE